MAPVTVNVFAVKFETKLFEIFAVTTFSVATLRVSTLAVTRLPEAILAVIIPKFVALPDATFSVFRLE